MIDFPITDLLGDAECLAWIERYLHPQGLVCPKCGSSDRRLFRCQSVPAYRCRACHAYYTILSGTVFAKTRQRPAALVLLLRGVAKGESTARLSRELDIDRKRLGEIRQQLHQNRYDTLPNDRLDGREFEADELYQNAGKKGRKHADPADPPRRRANKRKRRGAAHLSPRVSRRPQVLSGGVRCHVRDHDECQAHHPCGRPANVLW